MKQAIPQIALAAASAVFGLSVALAQSPAEPPPKPQFEVKNLKILPADTPVPQVIETMKGFTQALGVRCTHCHIGEEGKPLTTYDFASDEDPDKLIARDMMRLVHRLNSTELPAIGGLTDPKVTCYTCHRGSREPATVAPPTQS